MKTLYDPSVVCLIVKESKGEMNKTCKNCGREFETECESKVYCRKSCVKSAWKKRRVVQKNANNTPKPCAVCGKMFKPFGLWTHTCSKECSTKHKKNVMRISREKWRELHPEYYKQYYRINHARYYDHPESTCPICQTTFKKLHPRHLYCSDKCSNKRAKKSAEYPKQSLCKLCGELFISKRGSHLYCSSLCRERAKTLLGDPAKVLRLKISRNISSRISEHIHKKRNNTKFSKRVLGYSFDALFAHLVKTFKNGMTIDNYGTEWEIDHIIPMALHNFNNPSKAIKSAYALENLCARWRNNATARAHNDNQVGNAEKKDRLLVV